MANLKRNKLNIKHINNLSLAFELAKINLGSTRENPSVGCVVEKKGVLYQVDIHQLMVDLMLNLMH